MSENVTATESTPAPATGGAPSAETTPSAPAAPVAATPQTGTPISTPTDDRSNWVPPHRIRETRESAFREAQQQYAQREAEIAARYNEMERKFQALAGFAPPPNPEVENVRNQFGQLYPGLAKIDGLADKIAELVERSGDLESQNQHYWQSYGRQTMDKLFDHAAKELGSPLSDEGKRALHATFVGWVQQSPEMQERYAKDPTLVEEFWNTFTSSFISPARRAAAANVVNRTNTALPRDTAGGAPQATPAPKMGSLDERANAAWSIYQAHAKT